MKVALCLHGLSGGKNDKSRYGIVGYPVDYELALPHFRRHVLEHNDVDVFFHTWNVELEDDLCRDFQPKKHQVDKQIVFVKSLKRGVDKRTGTNVPKLQMTLSRWYGSREVLRLKREYEEENDFRYDMVMVSRFDNAWLTDVHFDRFDPHFFWSSYWDDIFATIKGKRTNIWPAYYIDGWDKRVEELTFRHHGWPGSRGFQDFWFFSGSKTMDAFGELYDLIPTLYKGSKKSNHQMAMRQAVHIVGRDRIRLVFHWFKDYTLTRRLYQGISI